jgi:hypothetical protein
MNHMELATTDEPARSGRGQLRMMVEVVGRDGPQAPCPAGQEVLGEGDRLGFQKP